MSFSQTRFAPVYFAVQAVTFVGWWLVLWWWPAARWVFVPTGAGVEELLAFWLPDLGVAALGSAVAAWGLGRGWRGAPVAAWLTTGAVLYAAAYCVGWALLRDDGWWNVVLMTPAGLLSWMAAWDASPEWVPVFRRARAARSRRHVLVTGVQVVSFWGFFLGLAPWALVWVESRLPLPRFDFPGRIGSAAVLFVGASALGLASAWAISRHGQGTPLPFDATNRLVVRGPYRWLRNPMVVAGLAQGVAVGLAYGSWTVLAYAGLGGILWQGLVRPGEERDLAETFGPEYEAYRRAVRCWIPRRPTDRPEA